MQLSLTGMDVMNRRDKKNEHCNPNWRDYDNSMIEEKIKKSFIRKTVSTLMDCKWKATIKLILFYIDIASNYLL